MEPVILLSCFKIGQGGTEKGQQIHHTIGGNHGGRPPRFRYYPFRKEAYQLRNRQLLPISGVFHETAIRLSDSVPFPRPSFRPYLLRYQYERRRKRGELQVGGGDVRLVSADLRYHSLHHTGEGSGI